jgi:hypothetical protein
VAEGWRILHNEELHNLYSSPNITTVIESRRVRWTEHVARIREDINAYQTMVGEHEGKTPLGIYRHTWEDNIKMDLREMGWKNVDWIHLPQDRDQWRILVNMVMNLRVP